MQLFLVLAALVTAQAAVHPLAWSLSKRQSPIPNVPPQCKSACDPVNDVIGENEGCPPTQCCTERFATGYFECFKCVGNAANITRWDLPQSFLDGLVVECSLRGIKLPTQTFDGQNPNRTLSTLSFPGSSTGSSTSLFSQSTLTGIITPTTSSTVSQVTITAPPSATNTAPPAQTSPAGNGALVAVAASSSSCLGIVILMMMFMF